MGALCLFLGFRMHKVMLAAFLSLPLLGQVGNTGPETKGPMASPLGGDLIITTRRIVLDKNRKTGDLLLINGGPVPHTYRVSLSYRTMDQTGGVATYLEPKAGDPPLSAVRWSPKQVTIPPGASQSIRVSVRAPADFVRGELLYNLTIQALPELPNAADVAEAEKESAEKAKLEEGASLFPRQDVQPNLTPTLRLSYAYSIPLIARVGNLAVGKGQLSGLVVEPNGSRVTYRLARVAGDTSLYGTIRGTITPPAGAGTGAKVQTALVNGIGLYLATPERMSYLNFDAPILRGSKVRLEWLPEGATSPGSVAEVEAP